MKKVIFLFVMLGSVVVYAQQTEQANLINKINKTQQSEGSIIKEQTLQKEEASSDELIMQKGAGSISKIIVPPSLKKEVNQEAPQEKQEVSTKQNDNSAEQTKEELKQNIKKEASPKPVLKIQNQDPQGIDWISLSKGKLNVKMQRRTNGIPTPNLSMKFNNVYQSLFRNIPWLMGGSANVYVYQNRQNFLAHEPVASDWSGAFFSPENNRIVMYDEPNKVKKMLSQFEHELTHLFVENYFCPPNSGKPEPPVWLNEGLAVNMEDITNNPQGGVWARDLIVMNILPSPKGPAASLKAPRPVSNVNVQFIRFSDFVNNNSYDSAVANNKVEDWYMQAYSMVRFLFKPYNNQYPEKRIQFEQLTRLLNTYQNKKDAKGQVIKDKDGRQIKIRTSLKEALKKAYGYNSIDDFELKFWQWLYPYQAEQRDKLND